MCTISQGLENTYCNEQLLPILKEHTSCLQAVHKQWCELREKIIQLQQEHDDEEAELKLLLKESAEER